MKRLLPLLVLLFVGTSGPVQAQDLESLLSGQGEKASEDELKAAAAQIVKQVSEQRGLSIKRPVKMKVQSKAEIRAYVEKRLSEEIKPDELQGQEWALKRLGLLPADYPLKEKIVALYEEQIAGYYDPFDRQFYIADWIPLMMQAPIMAHELTHALQDQHFDLRPYLTPIKNNGDATTARQALVEGDAVLTMMAYSFKAAGMDVNQIGNVSGAIRQSLQMQSSRYPVFAGAPMYLRESLMFPYTQGADFALAQKTKGGWKKVSATFRAIPASTEQVLHPEKYPLDKPVKVSLAAVQKQVPRKWKQIHNDVLGEFGISILLVKSGNEGVAAAAGWGGDQYIAYRTPDNRTVVVLKSAWDTEKDAQEFEAAIRAYSKSLDKPHAVIERNEKNVLWILGEPDEKTAGKLAKAGWGG